MKAITIQQPWAGLYFVPSEHGLTKTQEVRTWTTSHRGLLAVHTSQHGDRAATAKISPIGSSERAWVRGAIIGLVDLVDIQRCGNRWCWIVRSPILLTEPIYLPGQSGHLWNVPTGALRQL